MKKRQGDKPGMAWRIMRFAADTSGNAMMIMAISLIPIIGIVGSAFDMGRAYMVKTRLQQACDAGALAGRRAMTTNVFDTASETQARSFFRNNFPTGTFGTSGTVFSPRATSDGQVEAEATATVPMTLMRMFSIRALPIQVECEAILEVANTDIMFVLDVTGSMNCPTSTTNSDCNLVEDTNAKIKALRTAVVNFYTTLNSAISNDARLRIGFMPYSTTVNVGYSLPASYLKSEWYYQSRERRLINSSTNNSAGSWSGPNWPSYSSSYTVGSEVSSTSNNCNNTNYPLPNPNPETIYGTESSSGPVVGAPDSSTGAVATTTTYTRLATQRNWRRQFRNNKCVREYQSRSRTETKTDTSTMTPNYDWDYKRVLIPTATMSTIKSGGSVSLLIENATDSPANGPGQPFNLTWDGCVEERQTVPNATFSTIPSNAYDLNIDLIPNSEETRWAPALKEIIWRRNSTSSSAPDPGTLTTNNTSGSGIQRIRDASDRNSYACPKTAQKLKVMTLDDVKKYINASPYSVTDFKARGYTYHDVGMIWGARFISPDGIFGSENKEVPTGEKGAGKPINRHIIYMTDGQMDTDATAYGLYGLEMLDKRVNASSGSSTNNDSRHNSRFAAVCTAAKDKNITIWVVAYASTLTTTLSTCATPGKAFTASNDAQLQQQFQTIANKIAELRLSR